jgi:hypothetical protein
VLRDSSEGREGLALNRGQTSEVRSETWEAYLILSDTLYQVIAKVTGDECQVTSGAGAQTKTEPLSVNC